MFPHCSKSVSVVVFSPTGGTKNAAYLLAAQFCTRPRMLDQTNPADRSLTLSFDPEELVLLAAPSFGGKVPYAPGLFTNLHGHNTPCILICTYGNRACEHNLAQMYRTASEQGFLVIGAITLITPHTLAIRAGHSRPDLHDLELMQDFAANIQRKLAAGSLHPITPPQGDPAPTEHKRAKTCIPKHRSEDACVHCGRCVRSCPEEAIHPDTLDIDEDLCIQCQRCSYICPTGARSYTADWDAVDARCSSPRNEITCFI